MINKVRNWLRLKKIISTVDATGITPSFFTIANQEDTLNSVKSFNKAFDAQQQQMQVRSMVAHEPGCDVLTCKKVSCFIHEPDKIVEIDKVKTTRKRTKKPIGD